MGGLPFTLPCTLFKNGISVNLYPLIDTGACGYVFIDTRLATDLCRLYGLKPLKLRKPIYPKGYNSNAGSPIIEYLNFGLKIDGRKIYNIPILILSLGTHDMIIGNNFFSYFHILLDQAKRKLQWPQEIPRTSDFSTAIVVHSRSVIRPKIPNLYY